MSNCFSMGSVPEFLRKPIATCDILERNLASVYTKRSITFEYTLPNQYWPNSVPKCQYLSKWTVYSPKFVISDANTSLDKLINNDFD